MLDNMNDVRYFSENLDVTWRLYYEIASMAIVTIIMAVVLIILHSFIKNQGIGILKAVVLLVTGIGMLILCIGYFFYNMLTVGAGALLTASASTGMVTVAGIGVIVAAVIWLIYMCIWGFTSFFKGFHVAAMALLALGFVFAFLLMGFHLLVTYQVCRTSMPSDAMFEIMRTPVMVTAFMVLSLLACLEDFLAKRTDRL